MCVLYYIKLIYVRAMKLSSSVLLVFVSLTVAANGVLGDGKSLEQSDAAARAVDVEAMRKMHEDASKISVSSKAGPEFSAWHGELEAGAQVHPRLRRASGGAAPAEPPGPRSCLHGARGAGGAVV